MTVHTLVIVRHAHAQGHCYNGDHARALDHRGIDEAARLGEKLAVRLPTIDTAVISDARRTQQTYDILSRSLEVKQTQTERALYWADVPDVLDIVRGLCGDTVMIVGHEPTVSGLGALLADGDQGEKLSRGVPTATALLLRFSGQWEDLRPQTCSLEVIRHDRCGR